MTRFSKRKSVLSFALCLVFLQGSSPAPLQAQVADATGLVAAEQVLGRLDTCLSDAINSGDLVAANRIRQVRIETEQVLREVRNLIHDGVSDANSASVRSFTSVQDILVSLRQLTGSSERKVFLDINSTLINTSYLFPRFLGGKTFVVGIDPPRSASGPVDRDVFFVGLFPYVTDDRPAQAEFMGHTYSLRRYANNRLGFRLPKQALPEERFLEVKLLIPDRKVWYAFWNPTTTIYDRLYIGKTNPFTFSITSQTENPLLWETVVAPSEIHYYADSNQTSNIGSLTAPEAFRLLVPNAALFDADSAVFEGVAHRESADGPCNHVSRSAEFGGWDAHTVSWRLRASSMPSHMDGFSLHGGGGSNANIWLRPTFKVKKRGVAPTISLGTETKAAAAGRVLQLPIANQNWESIVIVGNYKDGDIQISDSIVLKHDNLAGTKPGWSVEINNGVLIITTRA